MVKGKEKFALWITPEAKEEVERHFRQDNCQSKSEYIETAIRFYSGYLDADHADSYLPRVLSEVLNGKLSALGSHIGKLLFKLSVDENIMANIAAANMNLDLNSMKRLRVRCIREVKETNGEINFEDAFHYQKDAVV
jgi:hypothetical protein